ncbi:MAG: 2-amino-4-hydroxy-6-hydroxymethyldihydropteridine diphosphokinase [Spongiibacteraceae bacterium]
MTRVVIGIGSNIEPERHIVAALDALSSVYGELLVSPVYESEAIGFAGPAFLNLVVALDTEQPLRDLSQQLLTIERGNNYLGGAEKFSSRTLDLDLLLYGDLVGVFGSVKLPRADIVDYAYTLWPLVDIAGDARHPVSGLAYRELKKQFLPQQKLRRIPFVWNGKELSGARQTAC